MEAFYEVDKFLVLFHDEEHLRSFIDYQIAQGVDGITIFGSTGGVGSSRS